MTQEDSPRFHWYQCLICGKIFDSEDAHRAHEKRCRDREALTWLLENQRLTERTVWEPGFKL